MNHAMPDRQPRTERVQSLSRGLAVIRAFERHAQSMTLTEVAERAGLPRAVARRFLLTLVQDGYASTDGRRFRLTPKILDLGFAFLTSMDIAELAQPAVAEVAAATQESCSASMLDGTDIIYVARVAGGRIMQIGLNVGSRLPAFCTSMGRVLLAHLPAQERDAFFRAAHLVALTPRTVTDEPALRSTLDDVRRQGWALVDEELEPGLRSISVPIMRRSGTVVAAMTVCTHASRRSLDEMVGVCLPPLREAAARVSRSLTG